jgi:hypothetical protein
MKQSERCTHRTDSALTEMDFVASSYPATIGRVG